MTEKLTLGLVEVRERNNIEESQVVGQVAAVSVPGYRCCYCDVVHSEDAVTSGGIYQCYGCFRVHETSGEEPTPCCYYEDDDGNDDEDNPYEFTRLDGQDGTVEGLVCPDCSNQNALLEEANDLLVRCEECDEVINPEDDSVAAHLYEHLQGAWE